MYSIWTKENHIPLGHKALTIQEVDIRHIG
jgi:hypothetical protein